MTRHYVTVREYDEPSSEPTLEQTFGPYTQRGAMMVARQKLGKDHRNYSNYSIEEFHYDPNDPDPEIPLLKLKVTSWSWDRRFTQGICRVVTVSK